MPALNQLGIKPEVQEGVRWNLGQAGRKHQEETPAAAVEAKEWAEALRQIITGRVAAVADVRLMLSGGGWDGTCEERGTVADPSFMHGLEFSQWLVEMLKIILEISLVERSLTSRVVILNGFLDFL